MTFDDALGHPLSRSAALLPRDGSALTTHGALTIEMQRGTVGCIARPHDGRTRDHPLAATSGSRCAAPAIATPSSRTGAGTGDRS